VGGHRQPGPLLTALWARAAIFSPCCPEPFVCMERGGEMPSCCRSGRAAGTRGSYSTHTGGTGGERALPRSFCSLSLGSGVAVQPSTTVGGFLPAAQLCTRERDSAPTLFSLQAYTFPFFQKFLSFFLPPPSPISFSLKDDYELTFWKNHRVRRHGL